MSFPGKGKLLLIYIYIIYLFTKDDSSDGKTGKTIVLTRPTRRRTLTPTPSSREQPEVESRRKSMSPTRTTQPVVLRQSLSPAVSRDQPEYSPLQLSKDYPSQEIPLLQTPDQDIAEELLKPSEQHITEKAPSHYQSEEPPPQPPEDSPSEESPPQPPEDSSSEEPPLQLLEESSSDHEELFIPKPQLKKDHIEVSKHLMILFKFNDNIG